MRTIAVVPIHALAVAKSRLAGALSAEARAALVLALAPRVLAALGDAAAIAQTVVVSPDARVLSLAAAHNAVPLCQDSGGLTEALDLAREWALTRGAEALLVALGDLPLLRPAEVDAAVAAARAGVAAPALVLAPDRAGMGTNLAVLHPPHVVPFLFGAGSCARFKREAMRRGVPARVVALPGAAFDVDTVADVREVERLGLWRAPTCAASEDGGVTHDAGARA